jgi:hypothetical protein
VITERNGLEACTIRHGGILPASARSRSPRR